MSPDYGNTNVAGRVCPCNQECLQKYGLKLKDTVKSVVPFLRTTWNRGANWTIELAQRVFPNIKPHQENFKLSFLLRNDTTTLRKQNDQSPFFKQLLKGNIDAVTYLQYLTNFIQVYQSLEEALRVLPDNSPFKALRIEALERSALIQADITSLSQEYNLQPDPIKSATEYSQYLKHIAKESPHLLLAHCYVHYMGDLSGGPLVKRMVLAKWPNASNYYNLDSMYKAFPGAINLENLRTNYRAHLDSFPLSSLQRMQIITEANEAFKRTISLLPAITDSEK